MIVEEIIHFNDHPHIMKVAGWDIKNLVEGVIYWNIFTFERAKCINGKLRKLGGKFYDNRRNHSL